MQATTRPSSGDSHPEDAQSEASTSSAPDGGVLTTLVSHNSSIAYFKHMKLLLDIL